MSAAYDSMSMGCATTIVELDSDELTPVPDPPPSGIKSLVAPKAAQIVADRDRAFRTIYEAHSAFVWRNLRRLGVADADVEDKLQVLSGADVTIVQWGSTDEEAMLSYSATATAMRALGRKLETRVWPLVTLSDAARDTLERELSELAPALREEAFLPDWEFEGEHKLPIIPEPLGIISLSRTERRVDPLSSLTAALGAVVVVLGLVVYFIVRPPWVPGR